MYDAVATCYGLVNVGVSRAAGLKVVAVVVITETAFAGRLVEGLFISRVLNQMEPDDAVAAVDGLQSVVVRAGCAKLVAKKVIRFTLAEVAGDRGLVGVPITKV